MSNIKPSQLQKDRGKIALTLHAQAKDRVLIAEAIWPEKEIYQIEPGRDDGGFVGYNLANGTFRNFNPYTDANDDCEVLKWAREKRGIPRDVGLRYRNFMFELQLLQAKRDEPSTCLHDAYEIGDYASAAIPQLIEDSA